MALFSSHFVLTVGNTHSTRLRFSGFNHFMNFWQSKNLTQMSTEEWESLCDNCGKCCLNKLEDADTGKIFFTSAVCKLYDLKKCRCSRYPDRFRLAPRCLDVKQLDFSNYSWLPASCAYRLLGEGMELPEWHPLVSKNARSVKNAGVAINSYAVKESDVNNLEDHVIEWLT